MRLIVDQTDLRSSVNIFNFINNYQVKINEKSIGSSESLNISNKKYLKAMSQGN